MTGRPARVTEVKRHLDGRVERFDCLLVLLRRHVAVIRYDHERERRAGQFVIPAGSRSYGFFWPRRPYSLYRMESGTGTVIAHRFDVVDDVRLGKDEVSYVDLLLDVWIDPEGDVRLEDEAQVEEYARRGMLSPARRARIERARALLLRRHRAIAREAAALLDEVRH